MSECDQEIERAMQGIEQLVSQKSSQPDRQQDDPPSPAPLLLDDFSPRTESPKTQDGNSPTAAQAHTRVVDLAHPDEAPPRELAMLTTPKGGCRPDPLPTESLREDDFSPYASSPQSNEGALPTTPTEHTSSSPPPLKQEPTVSPLQRLFSEVLQSSPTTISECLRVGIGRRKAVHPVDPALPHPPPTEDLVKVGRDSVPLEKNALLEQVLVTHYHSLGLTTAPPKPVLKRISRGAQQSLPPPEQTSPLIAGDGFDFEQEGLSLRPSYAARAVLRALWGQQIDGDIVPTVKAWESFVRRRVASGDDTELPISFTRLPSEAPPAETIDWRAEQYEAALRTLNNAESRIAELMRQVPSPEDRQQTAWHEQELQAEKWRASQARKEMESLSGGPPKSPTAQSPPSPKGSVAEQQEDVPLKVHVRGTLGGNLDGEYRRQPQWDKAGGHPVYTRYDGATLYHDGTKWGFTDSRKEKAAVIGVRHAGPNPCTTPMPWIEITHDHKAWTNPAIRVTASKRVEKEKRAQPAPDHLESLLQMGFSEEQAQWALKQASGSLEKALEALVGMDPLESTTQTKGTTSPLSTRALSLASLPVSRTSSPPADKMQMIEQMQELFSHIAPEVVADVVSQCGYNQEEALLALSGMGSTPPNNSPSEKAMPLIKTWSKEGKGAYRVVTNKGIALRRSRNMADRVMDRCGPLPGSIVETVRQDGDWVQLTSGYWIPLAKDGVTMLEPVSHETAAAHLQEVYTQDTPHSLEARRLRIGVIFEELAKDSRELCNALATGRVALSQLLLEAGALPEVGYDGRLPLEVAEGTSEFAQAADGSDALEVMESLAPPQVLSSFDSNGRTPLHRVAAAGQGTLVLRYLSWGADPAARDRHGRTPIALAVNARVMGSVAVMNQWKDALTKLATPEALSSLDDNGSNVLHHAINAKRFGLVKLLVSLGASPDQPDGNGRSPLSLLLDAAQGRDPGELQAVYCALASQSALRSGRDGATPLHLVAAWHRPELIALLVDCGADITLRDAKGKLAVHCYLENLTPPHLDTEVLQRLATPATLTAQDNQGLTPLHYAVTLTSPKAAQCLVSLGASPESVSKQGQTPLHVLSATVMDESAQTSVESLYKALITPDTINALDSSQATPLHVAARHCNVYGCQVLVANGADANIKDGRGLYPLLLAEEAGMKMRGEAGQSVIKLLRTPQALADSLFRDTTAQPTSTANPFSGL